MSKKNNILMGVCGGISAYKTCELVRLLIKNDFSVKVMMTEAATKFVTPLTFQTLSKEPVYIDMFQIVEPLPDLSSEARRAKEEAECEASPKGEIPAAAFIPGLKPGGFLRRGLKETNVRHISLAQWAKICVIAPLSAGTLSKIAYGICDNLLTTVLCALPQKTKILLVPAMNENMWKNPVIAENVQKLKKVTKYIILPPQKGELACGDYGEGRMSDVLEIYKKIKSL